MNVIMEHEVNHVLMENKHQNTEVCESLAGYPPEGGRGWHVMGVGWSGMGEVAVVVVVGAGVRGSEGAMI